jgi:heme exporter protein A
VTPIAALDGIEVRLGRLPVLRGVDFMVSPGEAVGVVGPNGSGKTTLLRVLATLQRPVGGSGTVLGAPLGSGEVRRIRPRIGLAGHQPALWADLTLRENLVAIARLGGLGEASADEALYRVGLSGAGARPAGHSSHGMRRRVDLARLLLTRPRFVLLDEAAAGLDRAARVLVDAVVAEALGAGGAAVLVSHDTEHLGAAVTRVVEIEDGQMRPSGARR